MGTIAYKRQIPRGAMSLAVMRAQREIGPDTARAMDKKYIRSVAQATKREVDAVMDAVTLKVRKGLRL